jgi:pentatricopeptide repeat protein
MMLDGVQPVRDTFHTLIVGTMKGSRLQDALYFRDQMKEMGLQPDVRPLIL